MARRRSRAQRSISLEMLIGIVIALMVLSFLAGYFLGSRRAANSEAAGRAVEVTVTAAAEADKALAEADADKDTAGKESAAAEKDAAETEPSDQVSVETTEAAAETEAETTEAGAAESSAAQAAERSAAAAATTAAATTETRAAAATTAAATAETSAAAATTAAATEAAASATSGALSRTDAATGRAVAGDPEPGEAPTYLDNVIKDSPLVGVAAGTVYAASDIDTANPEKYTQILSIEEGDYVYSRMNGRSWQRSNEVALSDLRYVKVLHYNDEGKIQVGEMVVHKDIMEDVTDVFAELFRKKYAVGSMHLIDDYFSVGKADAVEAYCAQRNNSTAFCSGVKASDGTPRAEAYGKAVLLNPGKTAANDAAEAVFSAYGFTKNGVRYEKR